MADYDRCACGGLWVGGTCSRCGAVCNCAVCRRGRAEIAEHERSELEWTDSLCARIEQAHSLTFWQLKRLAQDVRLALRVTGEPK